MNVFLVNSLIDINKYIDLDDITDVRIIEGESLIFRLSLSNTGKVIKKSPFLVPYIHNSNINIKANINTQDFFKTLMSKSQYTLMHTGQIPDKDIQYNMVLLSTLSDKCHTYLTNQLSIIQSEKIIFVIQERWSVNTFFDVYCNDLSCNTYVNRFIANLYRNNDNEMLLCVFDNKSYHLKVSSSYNVYHSSQRLSSTSDFITAIKSLMRAVFKDKEMYNKYIAKYPDFLKGITNE